MTKPIASLLIAVGVAAAACGPTDPMQSREAKECRQLLTVRDGWRDVGTEAEERVQAAKKRNAEPYTKGLGQWNENVYAEIDWITAERDRAVATCVLKMKGGQ